MAINLNDIVEELDNALVRWATSRRETKEVVGELRGYYGNCTEMSKENVISRAEEDKKKIKTHLTEHQKIAAKARNAARNLRTQVESSENSVVKMRKYGRLAAVGFTVLGVGLGLALELNVPEIKIPGLGQVIAVVVGAILGGFSFGCFALAIYLFMSNRAQRRAKLWKRIEGDNEEGLGLANVVEPKRTQLFEVYNLFDDLQGGNYESTIAEMVNQMDEYMAEK